MPNPETIRRLMVILLLGIFSRDGFGDWKQYRGPHSDGTTAGKILKAWPSEGPPQIWKRPIRSGFSSFVLEDKTLCTLVLRTVDGVKVETCLALDRDTGKELWVRHLNSAKYTGVGFDSGDWGAPGNQGGDGPRSTPAIEGDRVYVMSSVLKLFCLDARNGEILWERDLIREHGGTPIIYENAASPLIEGDLVLVGGGGPGQSILGINRYTGSVVWKEHDEHLTHSTPTVANIHGERQVIFFTRSGLVSIRAVDGKKLWQHPFPYRVCAAISPVVTENLVYCSAGYGIGSTVLEIAETKEDFSANEVWRLRHNEPVSSYWSTPIHSRGSLYGVFGFKKFGTAPLKCVDLKTGKVNWSRDGFGHGNVIRVDDVLVALAGHGELVLIEPSPEQYKELARMKILSGKCWSTPIFSNGRLYARSTTEAVCLELGPHKNPEMLADSVISAAE